MRAIVKPSQRSPDNPHKAEVAVKSDGLILPGYNSDAVYRPYLHCAHMPILEVVVRLETLPLHQLLMRVHPTMIHKIVDVQAEWTKTCVVLELAIVPCRERVTCLLQSST